MQFLERELRQSFNNNRFSFEESFDVGDSKFLCRGGNESNFNIKHVGVTVFSRNVTAYRQAQADLARSNAFRFCDK